jgi:hypothetical protein
MKQNQPQSWTCRSITKEKIGACYAKWLEQQDTSVNGSTRCPLPPPTHYFSLSYFHFTPGLAGVSISVRMLNRSRDWTELPHRGHSTAWKPRAVVFRHCCNLVSENGGIMLIPLSSVLWGLLNLILKWHSFLNDKICNLERTYLLYLIILLHWLIYCYIPVLFSQFVLIFNWLCGITSL